MCVVLMCFYDQHLLVTADYKCGCLHREEIQVYFECIELGAEAMAVQWLCYVWKPSLPTQQKQRLVTQVAERPPILTQYFTRAAAAVLCW